MSASKNRPLWSDVPRAVRGEIEQMIGGTVADATTCPGGFSPGFASRLTLADGRRFFVKAMDSTAWPWEGKMYRAEARISAALPESVPAPRLLGALDGDWVVLAFEHIDGAEPAQPWTTGDLDRVVETLPALADIQPPPLPHDHPRLGGLAELVSDPSRLALLREHAPWAAALSGELVDLERDGLAAARGDRLVHFDLYPHNILLTPERVVFVDWPHAQLGAPVVDLVTLLTSAAADGLDPEPIAREHAARLGAQPLAVDAILTAHAGFELNGGLSPWSAGLEPIGAAKLRLGLGALSWLRQRLGA